MQRNSLIKTLLFLTLLLAQQLVLAQHGLEFEAHEDNEPCELCLVSAGLDQGAASEPLSAPLLAPVAFDTAAFPLVFPRQPVHWDLARAPPLQSKL